MTDDSADLRDLLDPAGAGDESLARRALRAMRLHLDLQVAYVSEFVGDRTVFREVDAPGLEHLIKKGDSRPLDEVYCRHILAGRLPQLIPDTAKEPIAAALPITHAVPIGAHVSVPLTLPGGEQYGMFCCLGPQADASLNERDLRMMKAFADLVAFEIHRESRTSREAGEKRRMIEDVLGNGGLKMAFQPIWSIARNAPLGYETLARFSPEPVRPPNLWFADAAEAGIGRVLEIAAIRAALIDARLLPDGVYVAVNASPDAIADPELARALDDFPGKRLVVEITEHAAVEDYDQVAALLAPLRARGVRIAVDDAGAGYSSLQHILKLRPDIIKLDRTLIEGIGVDPGRRALAAALLVFARETGSSIVAEGVETDSELAMLRALGIDLVQGFRLGRPAPIAEVLAGLETCEQAVGRAG